MGRSRRKGLKKGLFVGRTSNVEDNCQAKTKTGKRCSRGAEFMHGDKKLCAQHYEVITAKPKEDSSSRKSKRSKRNQSKTARRLHSALQAVKAELDDEDGVQVHRESLRQVASSLQEVLKGIES